MARGLELGSSNSKSLVLSNLAASWKIPPSPTKCFQVIYLLGQPLWYVLLENFPLQSCGGPQCSSYSSLTWKTFNVWNSDPVTFKSLFLSQTSESNPWGLFYPLGPKSSVLGAHKFSSGQWEKKLNWLQGTQKKTEINKHLINCLQNVTLCHLL